MITTKKALAVLLPTRLVKELVTVPIYIAVMFGIHVFFEKYKIYDMVLGTTEDKEENEDENATAEKSESLTETSKNLENETGEYAEFDALNDNSAGKSEKQTESGNGDNKNEANS